MDRHHQWLKENDPEIVYRDGAVGVYWGLNCVWAENVTRALDMAMAKEKMSLQESIETLEKHAAEQIQKDQEAHISEALKAEIEQTHDAVNHPKHYTQGEIECIDAIKEAVKHLEGEQAYCTAAAIKYLWRWKLKNGVECLRKARWYLDRLIESEA